MGTQDALISHCKYTALITANYDVNKDDLAGREGSVEGWGPGGGEGGGGGGGGGALIRCGEKPTPPSPPPSLLLFLSDPDICLIMIIVTNESY